MEMATDSVIKEFILYNNWANGEVFRVCEGLTAEQLDATTPGSYGTIRDTLEHILNAEAFYVMLLTGNRPEPSFRWKEKTDAAKLSTFLPIVGQALLEAVGNVGADTIIVDKDEGGTLHYKAMAIFIQIVNHGIEHRTNITTILQQQGVKPPEVDGWGYLWGNRERMQLEQSEG